MYIRHFLIMFHECIYLCCCFFFPAGKWRRNDVTLMSMRHDHVASMSVRRHYDVMCLLGKIILFLNKLGFIMIKIKNALFNSMAWPTPSLLFHVFIVIKGFSVPNKLTSNTGKKISSAFVIEFIYTLARHKKSYYAVPIFVELQPS